MRTSARLYVNLLMSTCPDILSDRVFCTQIRPGMDLSRVSFPTFILEPRSFLDKLSDSFYHADYITQATISAVSLLCI